MWKFWIAGVQIFSLLKITISQKWSKQDKVSDNCPKDRQKMENFLLKKIYWSWWERPEFGHLNGSLLTAVVQWAQGLTDCSSWLTLSLGRPQAMSISYHSLCTAYALLWTRIDSLLRGMGLLWLRCLPWGHPVSQSWVATWSCAYGLLIQRCLEKAGKSRFGDRLRQCRCNTLRPEASHKCFKVM